MKKQLTILLAFLLVVSALVLPGCEKSKTNSELFKDAASSLMDLVSNIAPIQRPQIKDDHNSIDTNFAVTLNELSGADISSMEFAPISISGAYKGNFRDIDGAGILHADLTAGEEKLNADLYLPEGLSSENVYIALPELLDKYLSSEFNLSEDSENTAIDESQADMLSAIQKLYADLTNGKILEEAAKILAAYITDDAITMEKEQTLNEDGDSYEGLTKLTLTLKGEQLQEIGQKAEELFQDYFPNDSASDTADENDTSASDDNSDEISGEESGDDTSAEEDSEKIPDLTVTIYTQKDTAIKAEMELSDDENSVTASIFVLKTDEKSVSHLYWELDFDEVNISYTDSMSLEGTDYSYNETLEITPKAKDDSENGDDKTNALKVPGKPDVQASSAAEGDDSEMLPDSGDVESGFTVPFADSKTLVKFEFKGAVEESKISGEGSVSISAEVSGINVTYSIPFEGTFSSTDDSFSASIAIDTNVMGMDIDAEIKLSYKFMENDTLDIPELNDENTIDIESDNAEDEFQSILQELQENYPTLYSILINSYMPGDYPDYDDITLILKNKDYSVTYTLYNGNTGTIDYTVPLEVVVEENGDITLISGDGARSTFTPPAITDESVFIDGVEFYNYSSSENVLFLYAADYMISYSIMPKLGSAYADVTEDVYCEYDENDVLTSITFYNGSTLTVTQDNEDESIYYIDNEKFVADQPMTD